MILKISLRKLTIVSAVSTAVLIALRPIICDGITVTPIFLEGMSGCPVVFNECTDDSDRAMQAESEDETASREGATEGKGDDRAPPNSNEVDDTMRLVREAIVCTQSQRFSEAEGLLEQAKCATGDGESAVECAVRVAEIQLLADRGDYHACCRFIAKRLLSRPMPESYDDAELQVYVFVLTRLYPYKDDKNPYNVLLGFENHLSSQHEEAGISRQLLVVRYALAERLYLNDYLNGAEAAINRAIETRAETDTVKPMRCRCLLLKALILARTDRDAECSALLEEINRSHKEAIVAYSTLKALWHETRSELLFQQSKYRGSLEEAKLATEILEEKYGDRHPCLVSVVLKSAQCLYAERKYRESLRCTKRCIELTAKVDNEYRALSVQQAARTLTKMGECEKSLMCYEFAYGCLLRTHTVDHPRVTRCGQELAAAKVAMAETDDRAF